MFTVLIAEKEHIDAIRQGNKLFFEPFLNSKELAFCYWNPAGQNLQDSVPGLLDAVGRTRNWRAIILNPFKAEQAKTQNPYDTVDYSGLSKLVMPQRQLSEGESWEDWEKSWEAYDNDLAKEKEAIYKRALELPLQKLATWLCFRPEDYILNDVKETQDAREWALEMLSKDEKKTGVTLELLERNQYKRDLRIKELVRREFVQGTYLNVAYPAEVHCVSIRTAENGFFDPDIYWNIRGQGDYSAFVDRNMFFDKMRFMVFDLLPRTHRDFRTDYIRFLATLLILASNPVPASTMQARRLYRLDVENDDTPLCTLVTSYDRKLAATSENIESEMEKIRGEIPGEMTDKAAEELFCTPKDVKVMLDSSCKPQKVLAEQDYGLFYDSPQDEFVKWTSDYYDSQKALNYIVKQQSRAVKKSVAQMHFSSEVNDGNISRLTPLQIDDIREYTNAAENEMVAEIPPDLADISRFTNRLEKESEQVKKVIRRRMTKKTTLILTGVCLGLYLLCFLPFLLSNHGTMKTVATAIGFSGAMVGLFGVILFVSLFFLRKTVLRAVRAYNGTAKTILNEIESTLQRVSKYLSASCNVRRGHAVQNYAKKNVDEYTMGLRIRRKHQEDIRKKRAYLAEEYGDYFGDYTYCDEVMSRPYEYDFDLKTEYAYPAPFLAGDCRQMEFLSAGNFVTVPSSYITKIMVRMEGIYDK